MQLISATFKWIFIGWLCFALLPQLAFAQGKRANRFQWQYDLKRAERQLRKADAASSNDELLLRYADVLFYQGKLDQAFPLYRKADSLAILKDLGRQRNYVYSGIQLNGISPYASKSGYFGKITSKYEASKFDVNSDKEDFSPFAWNDKVFVTSSRPTVYNKRKQRYVLTRFPFLDVHVFSHEASAVKADFLPKFLNGAYHDGPIAIAKDTSLLMLTRNYEQPDKNGTHHLYITVFQRRVKGWSDPEMLFFCEPTFTVQHPFYDDVNQTMYFSSNMPGGKGGFDLYRIRWDGKAWSKPENLGADINTSFDEVFPSLDPEGRLYYASNHIESMGGLDIVLYENGSRQLLPVPVNSVYDDFAISFKDGKAGYFTSNRNNAAFDDDIWKFSLPDPVKEPMVVLSVVDAQTNALLTNQNVLFKLIRQADSQFIWVNAERVTMAALKLGDSIEVTKVYDQTERLIEKLTYENQGDTLYWVKIFVREKPKPALPAPMVARVYFHNDRPKNTDILPKTSYADSYRLYGDSLVRYYTNSSDARAEIDRFWNQEVTLGWDKLQQIQKAVSQHLKNGGEVELQLSGHCSPLHTDTYNVELAKRRVEVVKRFVLNNQAVKSGLKVTTQFMGESQALPGISADLKDAPASVYGVKASLERRVDIKVVFK